MKLLSKELMGFLVVTLLGTQLWAQESVPQGSVPVDRPDNYTIEGGDTLWDLSEVFYQNPWFWPRIWYANDVIDNPHLIFPGQVLVIPGIEAGAASKMMVDTTEAEAVAIAPKEEVVEPEPIVEDVPYEEPLNEEEVRVIETVQESVHESRIDLARVKDKKPVHKAILRQVGNEEFLIASKDLKQTPQLIRAGRAGTLYATLDEFWVNRGSDELSRGDHLVSARKTKGLKSRRTGEKLGQIMQPTGVLKVVETKKKISRVRVIESYTSIEMDDYLFVPSDLVKTIVASNAEKEVQGKIVATAGDAMIAADWQRIFIDLGNAQGVKRGDILTVYRLSENAHDDEKEYAIPPTVIGSLVVVSTSEHGATGLILRSNDAIQVGDDVRTPGL